MFHSSLRYFYEVVRLGGIRKASEALRVAPSSISRQISILEREMGTKLLERSVRGVQLTHAGELVARYAQTVILDHDTLRADLDDLRGSCHALIRISVLESLISEAPLQTIRDFRLRFPDVKFQLEELPAPRISEAVRSGMSDIGATFNLEPDPELKTIAEMPESLVLAIPNNHPFARRTSVTITDIAELPLAVHESQHGVRIMLDRAFRTHDLILSPVFSSNSLGALRDFVRQGLGAAILTRCGTLHAEKLGQLRCIPIEEPTLSNGRVALIVLRKRRLPRVHRLFVQEFAENLKAAMQDPSPRRKS